MKPVEFKEQNVVFAKDQPEYLPLPALRKSGPEGEVVACWQLNFWERMKLLITGRMWVSLWSFQGPLTPSRLTVHKEDVIEVQ